MDVPSLIRAVIFLVAGLIYIRYPNKIFKLAVWFCKKLPFKYDPTWEKKYYSTLGVLLLIISVLLFLFAISN